MTIAGIADVEVVVLSAGWVESLGEGVEVLVRVDLVKLDVGTFVGDIDSVAGGGLRRIEVADAVEDLVWVMRLLDVVVSSSWPSDTVDVVAAGLVFSAVEEVAVDGEASIAASATCSA